MTAALRTFVLLWLPGLVMLLAGLPLLLRTGQVDPRAWAMPALFLILAATVLKARRSVGHAVWAGVGAFASVLLFIFLAAGRWPDPTAALWLGGLAALAVTAGILLSVRLWLGLVACGTALIAGCLSFERPVAPAFGPRPVLGVVTALPLFWRDGQGGMGARADAPIVTLLRQGFDVRPLDSPDASALSGVDALLLAQPRALPPAELVAIDKWVRAGGQALILADPLLRWPSSLPLGDRRRPPAVSLLTPLIAHWGLRLLPPSLPPKEIRRFLPDGRLVTGYAVSGFESAGSACDVEAEGLLARCALGRGAASLVADADLLDDRLWLADPAAPIEPRLWTADTPQFIAEALGGGLSVRARHWLRSEASLILALRWSILFGIFWAMSGSGVFACRNSRGLPRNGTHLSPEKEADKA